MEAIIWKTVEDRGWGGVGCGVWGQLCLVYNILTNSAKTAPKV